MTIGWQRIAMWINGIGAAFVACLSIHFRQFHMFATVAWMAGGWWQSRSAYFKSLREAKRLPAARVVSP